MASRYHRPQDSPDALVSTLKNWGKTRRVPYDSYWTYYMEASKYRFISIAETVDWSQDRLKILDIGTTPFTLLMKEVFPHHEIWTLDLTNSWESSCRSASVHFTQCDIEKGEMPFQDDYFDVVIFAEVLEHLLASPPKILREIRRTLVPHGKLTISVPNIAALYQRIRLLIGMSPLSVGHFHEYTMRELVGMLEGCGFVTARKKYVNGRVLGGGISAVGGRIYQLIPFLVPQFRSTIQIECYKAPNKEDTSGCVDAFAYRSLPLVGPYQ